MEFQQSHCKPYGTADWGSALASQRGYVSISQHSFPFTHLPPFLNNVRQRASSHFPITCGGQLVALQRVMELPPLLTVEFCDGDTKTDKKSNKGGCLPQRGGYPNIHLHSDILPQPLRDSMTHQCRPSHFIWLRQLPPAVYQQFYPGLWMDALKPSFIHQVKTLPPSTNTSRCVLQPDASLTRKTQPLPTQRLLVNLAMNLATGS